MVVSSGGRHVGFIYQPLPWQTAGDRAIAYLDNTTESLSVDDLSQITSLTDRNGHATSYTYDAVGRVNGISYPANDEVSWYPTTMTYNFVGSERGITGNHWRRTRTTGNYQELTYFDAMLQPVLTDTQTLSGGAVVAGSDISSEKQYDVRGRTAFSSYPVRAAPNVGDSAIANGTHSTYDALERLTQSRQDSELGLLTTNIAYSYGEHKIVTDPNGNVTNTAYQAFDQPAYDAPIQVIAPSGITQNIARDLYGNPTGFNQSGLYGSESDNVTKSLYYDSYHRLCRFTEPESGSTITTYDAANNVQTTASGLSIAGTGCGTIPAGAQTTYTYDPTNKVHTILPPAGTQSTSYVYDNNGNLTSAASGISVWSGNYNFRNLLTSETSNLNNGQFHWVLGYAHDAYGHLNSLTYPTGEVVTYAPNPRGFDAAAGSYAGTIAYNADGSMASEKFGNGINGYWNQNARLLPGSLIYGMGGVAKFEESYAYDANANLKTVADQINGQNNQTLGYDGLNRLTSASAPNAWGNEAFSYDPLNRLRQYVGGGVAFNVNYDATSRLSSLTVGSSTFSAYTSDPRGNRATTTYAGATGSYSFDAKNQLLAIPGTESYAYDAAGRRVMKTPASGGAAAAGYTFYDHAGQLMFGYTPATGIYTSYIYLNGKLIARHAGPTTTYLLTDRLGTPVRETDVNGNVTASFIYLPYGGRYSGPSQGGPGFTGHENDPETAFTYMQARYYDTGTGFLSPDPVAPTPGNVFNFSRYAYANNNPVTNTDPDGRQCSQCLYYGDSVDHQASINAGASGKALAMIGASLPFLAAAPAAGFVAGTAAAVATDSIAAGSLTVGIMANAPAVAASGAIVAEGVAAANGAPSPFSAEALVVRGGNAANQTAAKIDGAIMESRTPGVVGFSCQCDGGTNLSALGSNLRNNQLGVTTAGAIRAAGGEVVATPGFANHVTVTGLSGEQASPLMMVQKNPNPAGSSQ